MIYVKNLLIAVITFLVTTTLFSVSIDRFQGKQSPNYDVVEFARQKPELVRALKSKYEEQVKQIEANLVRVEKTPQDKLIEVVTEQLSPKN